MRAGQPNFGDEEYPLSDSRSIAQILHEIVNRAGEIMRSELRLAAMELKQDAAERAKAAALIGVAAALMTLCVGFILLGAVYALALTLPAWLSAILVGAAAGLVGGILLYVGQARMKQRPRLKMTTQTAEDNLRWLKNLSK